MEPVGILKAWTTKVRIIMARIKATTMPSIYSRTIDFFFFICSISPPPNMRRYYFEPDIFLSSGHGVLSERQDERERKLSAVFHAGEDKRSGEKYVSSYAC
jgi:hypothetical protein